MDYLLWVNINIETVLLPTNPELGQKITIRNDYTSPVTVSAQSTNTINAAATGLSDVDVSPITVLHLYCADNTEDAVKWLVI